MTGIVLNLETTGTTLKDHREGFLIGGRTEKTISKRMKINLKIVGLLYIYTFISHYWKITIILEKFRHLKEKQKRERKRKIETLTLYVDRYITTSVRLKSTNVGVPNRIIRGDKRRKRL